jgi:hypothetical protein
VRIARQDDQWAEGPFAPSPVFDDFRELFAREARLRHDQVIPLWEEVADTIEALAIQVVEEGQEALPHRLPVFIEGNEAILGNPER